MRYRNQREEARKTLRALAKLAPAIGSNGSEGNDLALSLAEEAAEACGYLGKDSTISYLYRIASGAKLALDDFDKPKPEPTCAGKRVEIDGKTYELKEVRP